MYVRMYVSMRQKIRAPPPPPNKKNKSTDASPQPAECYQFSLQSLRSVSAEPKAFGKKAQAFKKQEVLESSKYPSNGPELNLG